MMKNGYVQNVGVNMEKNKTLIQFSKPEAKVAGRIKFGRRKNGTKWYYGLPSRKIRREEKDGINRVLEMLYGK